MVLVAIVVGALVVTYGMMKLADRVFVDKPTTAFDDSPSIMGSPTKKPWHKDKVDLRYDPLAIDDSPCCGGVHRSTTKPEHDVPPVTMEQAEKFLAKVRENMKAPGRCLVCGDPMKVERVGQVTLETCDCPRRGYQPRS